MKIAKKLILLAMALLICSAVFATGKQEAAAEVAEEELPESLVVLYEGGTYMWPAWERFTEETGVSIDPILADYSGGSNKSLPPMIKAGERIDVYSAFIGRAGTYMVPVDNDIWTTIDLSEYPEETEIAMFTGLEAYTRRGKVLALPTPGGYQSLAVNLDILANLGYEGYDFDGWTVDDFLAFGPLVLEKYDGEKWLTGLFAGSRDSDYLVRHWFASFDAKFFEGGDFSRTVIDSPEALNTFRFFKDMFDAGYVNPDAKSAIADEYVLQWARGELLFAPYLPGWVEGYFVALENQGREVERFDVKFVSLPSISGKDVPVIGNTAVTLGVKSGNAATDRLIAKLVGMMVSKEVHESVLAAAPTISSPRIDVAASTDVWTAQVAKILTSAGTYDLGASLPTYTEQRNVLPKYLQALFGGEGTPEDLVQKYAEELNEILARPVDLY